MQKDWRDYEKQFYEIIAKEFPKAAIAPDEFIMGQESHIRRQIDIAIFFGHKKKKRLGIVECKYYKKKVNLNHIDALIGKMIDVRAEFALVYTTIGSSKGAQNYAQKFNIQIRVVPFEFLIDFDFVPSNFLEDILEQEVEYRTAYCSKCEKTNLYEIKIVRGFGVHEKILCPECKTGLFDTRTDGGYRVIKRFNNNKIPQNDVDNAIIQHLINTRETWDKRYKIFDLIDEDQIKYLIKIHGKENVRIEKDIIAPETHCNICSKKFDKSLPNSIPLSYDKYLICRECFMSQRTLLIDYDKL